MKINFLYFYLAPRPAISVAVRQGRNRRRAGPGHFDSRRNGATIFPGVAVGTQAIVAANAMVVKDVPENMLAAGTPAKIIRPRRDEGHTGQQLNHYWLADKAFQI